MRNIRRALIVAVASAGLWALTVLPALADPTGPLMHFHR
jgi:hypothetical protein